jgi:transposase
MQDLVKPPSEIKRRRRYSRKFKDKVLAECAAPNASTAEVAGCCSINANMIYNWRAARKAPSKDSFVQLTTSMPTVPIATTVQLKVQLGQGSINMDWPLDAIDRSIPWGRALLQCFA